MTAPEPPADPDAVPYEPAGVTEGRCRLESCTLPPHPPGTQHRSWRAADSPEDSSG